MTRLALLLVLLAALGSATGANAALSITSSPNAAPAMQSSAPPASESSQAPASERDAELERQVREVASELRCVVCQGLSIQDSPSTLAQEMRGVVREQLAAGRTPEQVRAYFVERYGEWVLLRPRPSGVNLLVYLLPVAMIVGGAAFIFVKARTWTRAAREGAA